MQFLSYSGPSLYSFCWNLQSQTLIPDFARVLSSWNFACWKHTCMHRTWSGTRFACQNVAPLGLFNLPLQMNSHLAIKRNVSCYVLRRQCPSYTQQEVWRRQSIWQCNQSCQVLWDSWPRWPMFSQAEGTACTWVLSLLGIFCLAVEIFSWCSTGLRCSPKRAVWWYHMLHHSQTLAHVLKAITSRLLPPQCLPQWPGHHSSHWATTLPHKSSSKSCAFKHCIYEHTCKVNKYA